MRVVTVSFNYPSQLKRANYEPLVTVFENSLQRNMPEAELRVLRVAAPDHSGVRKYAFLSNHFKLKIWVEQGLQAIEDGVDLMLADCDMVCLGDPNHVFKQEFDVAYTVRDDHTNIPLNGGVVFVKPTDAAARFLQAWYDADERMYADWEGFHQYWRVRYAGMNQASFGYLLENRGVEGVEDTVLLDLPTRIYNAVNTDWHRVNEDTLFLHIKSDLRKAVLRGLHPGEGMSSSAADLKKARLRAPAMTMWYEAAVHAGIPVERWV